MQNVEVNVSGLFGTVQVANEQFYYIGQAFMDNKLLNAEQVFALVQKAEDHDGLVALMQQLTGFYGLVLIEQERVIVVSDRTRSRPLFYSRNHQGNVYISDSADWLLEQQQKVCFAPLSEHEFRSAGYVTGKDTLVENVYQVQAGHLLLVNKHSERQHCYFQFMPLNGDDLVHQDELYQQLDQSMTLAIDKLIQYANGRQLVVPLSGGYDSRSIAIYLKKSGYKNVVTFTFGRMTSKEVLISQRIADALGFPWHFIEYNSKLWRGVKSSESFSRYLPFICSYVSVPNVQVYPAIKAIYEQGFIDNDSIIVPGHTGDFISGGHIPQALVGKEAESHQNVLVDSIVAKHFKQKVKNVNLVELKQKLAAQVATYTKQFSVNIPAASIFESWEFYERQAKFIVNSNRYYDFFKLDWWMPLWDENLIQFWQHVPLVERLNSKLWQQFVEDKYIEFSGEQARYGNVADQYHPKIHRLRNILDYFTDENGLYALVPFYRWLLRKMRFKFANGTLFSYLAFKLLRQLKRQRQ